MKQLVYTSIIDTSVDFEEIHRLLTKAVENNKKKSITGMMVYSNDYFLQCIEGEAKDIDELFKKIVKDKRHYDIKLLGKKDIEKRYFDEWNLGFINNSKYIKKLIETKTGVKEFEPYKFDYENARDILYKLSFMI